MIAATCPSCKRKRLVTQGSKKAPARLRTHFWPGNEPIPDRRQNGLCPGSGARVSFEEIVAV